MLKLRLALVSGFAAGLLASALVTVPVAYFASRPRADFSASYQSLGTPKLILFLDRTNQIPVQSVSRLHGVSSTWVYYDPADERSNYSRSRRVFRLRPNAAVQFRTDRMDTELTLLRTELAKLWGPRIEKDTHGETHYIFVSDALYQQDKDWHDHPKKLFQRYVFAACGISFLAAVLAGLAATATAWVMRRMARSRPQS